MLLAHLKLRCPIHENLLPRHIFYQRKPHSVAVVIMPPTERQP